MPKITVFDVQPDKPITTIRESSQITKVSAETLDMLCPYSFIILTIRAESQMKALGLYLGGGAYRSEGYFS